MSTVFVGVFVLIGLLLLAQWYASAPLGSVKKFLKWGLIVVGAAVALFFILSGKWLWAFVALPTLIPLILRARTAARMAKNYARMSQANAGFANAGETSEVKTRFLEMTLDHDTGEMMGIVVEGPYSGWSLSDLSLEQLMALWKLCRQEDEASVQVLEAFLDRNTPDWRDFARRRWGADPDEPPGAGPSGGGGGGTAAGGMTREQALSVLGLEEGASRDEIKAAYQRIISGLHPDRGGSDYLAAQVNEAKAVLLGD